jgi:radical SAM-linked protein
LEPVLSSAVSELKRHAPFDAGIHQPEFVADIEARSKVRFRYAKLGRAFFASHLDVKEHLLRAIRLSGIPAVYSEGFTPRPRVSFSPACPTAVASEAEYFEVLCTEAVDGRAYAEKLRTLLPDGLFLTDVEAVDPRGPSLEQSIIAMTYAVTRPVTMTPEALRASVDRFLAQERIPVRVIRKGRERLLDARAQITDVAAVGDALHLTIAFAKQATLKVREAVASILGIESVDAVRIRKRNAIFREGGAETSGHSAVSLEVGEDAIDLTPLSHTKAAPKKARPRRDPAQASSIPYAE